MDEADLRALIKREVARLIEGRVPPEEIADDEPLFSIPGECDSRIELDSLDGLELAFAVEEATGIHQPADLEIHELLNVGAIMLFVVRLRSASAAVAAT
jgi:acyl carrier protein